jgi:hypothetical protein
MLLKAEALEAIGRALMMNCEDAIILSESLDRNPA